MSKFSSNIIVATSPEEILHGDPGKLATFKVITIVNPAAGPWTCAMYYTRGIVRTKLMDLELDEGDKIVDKSPYTLTYGENLEIETSVGVEVTFTVKWENKV